jgi:hypothetical protein
VINKAAFIFGLIFIVQSILFLYEFILRNKIEFNFINRFQAISGYFLIIFGAIIYPATGLIAGKDFDTTISLGLPCPTVIYTFGILILAGKSLPKYLLIIPAIWSLIGFFAAINFGIYQDVVLPLSAFTAIYILYYHIKKEVIAN